LGPTISSKYSVGLGLGSPNIIMAVDYEEMARALEGTGDYRILRRFRPRDQFAKLPKGMTKQTGVILDVETTGLDTNKDEIIEIGMIKFSYVDNGAIGEIIDTFSALNEPNIPVPAEVVELTGITHEDLAGQHIDHEAVAAFVADAKVIIAHNAKFDRRMCERHCEIFKSKAWGCSSSQVEWRKKHGFESSRLDHLLRGVGLFHDGHRAIADCHAVLEMLVHDLKTLNRPAMALLLEEARRVVARVWAEGTSYSDREELKTRGYKWNNGKDGRAKSWYRDVDESASKDEVSWLRANIYKRNVDIRLQYIDALSRFSVRD